MAALDPTTDPTSLLNSDAYPTVWIPSGAALTTALPLICVKGVPVPYSITMSAAVTNPGLQQKMLKAPMAASTYSLIQFLSGGGAAAAPPGPTNDFTQLGNVILGTATAPKGIIDTYIVGSSGSGTGSASTSPSSVGSTFSLNKRGAYTYSTSDAPIISSTDLWSPSDEDASGNLIESPKSVLGFILKHHELIRQTELFQPAEFIPNANVPPGGESLVYLYRLSQQANNNLTPQQIQRKYTLETKNLRFFGAWMAEYAYYRSRYDWLLKHYFTIYSKQATGASANAYSSPSVGDPVFQLFTGIGTGETQYVDGSATTPPGPPLSQADYLKGLMYQMACLNTRMTDMRALLGQISAYYNGVFQAIQAAINDGSVTGSNADLINKINALNDSAAKAQEYLHDRDFHQGVMEYNSSKNTYANILLGLYAFLNISAVAVILHMYNN